MIKIFKGDDTNFRGIANLSLKINTSVVLTGCRVEFTLLGQKRIFTTTGSGRSLPFVFSAAETAVMPLGTHIARTRVFDSEGRVRTVCETPVLITDDPHEAYSCDDSQEIDISLCSSKDSLTDQDVFDCSASVTELKERIAYLWEKCGGTVSNRSSLNYEG